MSTSRLFFVALAMVSASAVFSLLTSEALTLDSAASATRRPVAAWSPPDGLDLPSQMASLQDMHERLAAARSDDERRLLLARSERVMSEGVAMMRRMKPRLPVSEAGKVASKFVTESEIDAVRNFLGLMELLVQLKEDQDALITPTDPTEPIQPNQFQPKLPAHRSVKSFA
jgi:hypothetical protein